MVKKLLNTSTSKGWRVLTLWEGYRIDDATWEPIAAFVHPDVKLNAIFKDYCEQHGLQYALKKTMGIASAQNF